MIQEEDVHQKQEEEEENLNPIWSSYQDEEGRTYYYNSLTQESTWDKPMDYDGMIHEDRMEDNRHDTFPFNDSSPSRLPSPTVNDNVFDEDEEQQGRQENEQEQPQQGMEYEQENQQPQNQPTHGEDTITWIAYKDDYDRTYYYNSITQVTQWEKPEGSNVVILVDQEDTVPEQDENIQVEGDQGQNYNDKNEKKTHIEEEEKREVDLEVSKDARISSIQNIHETDNKIKDDLTTQEEEHNKALQKAQDFLLQPDAILESNILDHVSTVLLHLGGQVGGSQVMTSLVQGYVGQTSICGLFAKWLVDLKVANTHSNHFTLGTNPTGSTLISAHTPVQQIDENYIHSITTTTTLEASKNAVRSILERVITKLALSHFTQSAQDAILRLPKAKATFVDEMMDYPEWRRLLIQLAAFEASSTKQTSPLLTYCLQSISKKGFHRDILKHIPQSGDYFRVFHAMLSSEFGTLGSIIIPQNEPNTMQEEKTQRNITHPTTYLHSSSSDSNSISNHNNMQDLKKSCTTTAYTYTFARALLQKLIQHAEEKNQLQKSCSSSSTTLSSMSSLVYSPSNIIYGAIRKWKRLSEELEEYMIRPNHHRSTENSVESGERNNPMIRKRRAHVALMVSELQQKQRRRLQPEFCHMDSMDGASTTTDHNKIRHSLESGLILLIKKYSLGISIDEHLLDQLLNNPYYQDVDDVIPRSKGGSIGKLLTENPLALSALLEILFSPNSISHGRSRSMELKMKSAKLLALSVLSAEAAALAMDHVQKIANGGDLFDQLICYADESELSRSFFQGSQLCEQVENMGSFTFIESSRKDSAEGSSVGHQLYLLCQKYAVVARGFLFWATERSQDIDFANLAAYPTMAPRILSLARMITRHHPFCRKAAMDLAFIFLKHTSEDLSYQKLQDLKEQSLRLLVFICTQGLAIDILSLITEKLRRSVGHSELDSALIRYFIEGILDVVRPPVSLPFVRSMGALLSSKACIEALNSVAFDIKNKTSLLRMFEYFQDAVLLAIPNRPNLPTVDDHVLMSFLKSTYSACKSS